MIHSAPKSSASNRTSRRAGFTLIEMLTVIVIIGIIATMALPHLPGLLQSNTMTSASRQLLDDLASARQKAINNRCRVYVVFLPPNFWMQPPYNGLQPYSKSNALQLSTGQYASYALYTEHRLGDQPGTFNPRYLTKWKRLPEGVIIETNMFRAFLGLPITPPEQISEPNFVLNPRVFPVASFTNDHFFPFPPAELSPPPPPALPPAGPPAQFALPYIAFDAQGQLWPPRQQDQFIPLVRASVFINRDANQQPDISAPADVIEPNYREPARTNYTLVHIDWLTGRARVEKPRLQ